MAYIMLGLLVFGGQPALSQDRPDYGAEVENIEHEMALLQAARSSSEPPAIQFLRDYRLAVLALSRDMLRQRDLVDDERIEIVIPATNPDQALADQIVAEIAAAQSELAQAEAEAEGLQGLLAAVVRLRVETLKATIALLSHQYTWPSTALAFRRCRKSLHRNRPPPMKQMSPSRVKPTIFPISCASGKKLTRG